MGFRSVKEMVDAYENGASWLSFFYRSTSPTPPGSGAWADMSMGPGTPKYNAYIGAQYEAVACVGAGNNSIYTGPTPSAGQTKHLFGIQIMASTAVVVPSTFVLLDYLLYYPLIDCDSTDVQPLINDTASLPRYTSGEGVMAMMVATIANSANATATLTYTNSAGVASRSTAFTAFSGSNVGALCSSPGTSNSTNSKSVFIPLMKNDHGIRSVESIQLSASMGGFCALVLVKPIAWVQVREAGVVSEMTSFMHRASLPRIYDGAFLQFVYNVASAGSPSPIRGHLEFVWG